MPLKTSTNEHLVHDRLKGPKDITGHHIMNSKLHYWDLKLDVPGCRAVQPEPHKMEWNRTENKEVDKLSVMLKITPFIVTLLNNGVILSGPSRQDRKIKSSFIFKK